jgi:hypothetical protein
MRTRVLCVIACALVSITLSPVAAGEGEPRSVAPTPAGKAAAAREPPGASGNESQPNRMKRCNEEAKKKALKGDERRGFMSTCLKGEPPGPAR